MILHQSLIVLRLSIFYKNEVLENSSFMYYRLFWLDNGRGMVFIHAGLKEGIKQYFLTNGWIVLFAEHIYRDFMAHFEQARDMLLFNRLTSQAYIDMDYEMLTRFNHYASHLQSFTTQKRPILWIQSILDTMLLQAGSQFDLLGGIKVNSWIDQRYVQIDALIQEHFREEKSDSFYAETSGLSLLQLNKICRKIKGHGILPLVNEARLSAAKSQLLKTSKSVKTIALELGFKTDSHFCNIFKRATKLRPMEYRMLNQPGDF